SSAARIRASSPQSAALRKRQRPRAKTERLNSVARLSEPFSAARHELRTRDTMRAICCENRNGATLQTFPLGSRLPPSNPLVKRLLGPGWFHHRLALSFGGAG